jgi:uncharacterized OB-fold protein
MITTPVKLWRRQKQTAALIGKVGTLIQWTIIRTPPKSFINEAPYPVIIIAMDQGKKMIGQLVDWDASDLIKGRKVIAVLRRFAEDAEGIISYVIKFKPL